LPGPAFADPLLMLDGYGSDPRNRQLHDMFRAAVNVIGNVVATLVIARSEKELDAETLRENLKPTH
jgi:hypothetical protein